MGFIFIMEMFHNMPHLYRIHYQFIYVWWFVHTPLILELNTPQGYC